MHAESYLRRKIRFSSMTCEPTTTKVLSSTVCHSNNKMRLKFRIILHRHKYKLDAHTNNNEFQSTLTLQL